MATKQAPFTGGGFLHVMKAVEGGKSFRTVQSELKEAGIRCGSKVQYSPFVGHYRVEVNWDDQDLAAKIVFGRKDI